MSVVYKRYKMVDMQRIMICHALQDRPRNVIKMGVVVCLVALGRFSNV